MDTKAHIWFNPSRHEYHQRVQIPDCSDIKSYVSIQNVVRKFNSLGSGIDSGKLSDKAYG